MLAGASSLGLETIPFSKTNIRLGGVDRRIVQSNIRGPGVMLQVRQQHTVAFTTRYRSELGIQGDGALPGWFRGESTPLNQPGNKSLAISADAFAEYAFSYAVSALNLDKHFLKVGGTYKLLRGLQTGSLAAEGKWREAAPAP